MSKDYIAKPPLILGQGSGGGAFKQIARMAGTTFRILWQVFVPFNPAPEDPDSLPEPKVTVTTEQVAECQWIFDQGEERREQLEQKAQWAFALILFLVPVLSSVIVYLMKESVSGTRSYWWAAVLIGFSALFLFMAFVSVVRAVSVQGRQTLFLEAMADLSDGQVRTYDTGFHARGLLWCASVNTAMNDHLAQFVKGAHLLSAAAVLTLGIAAIPTAISFLQQPAEVSRTSIVYPVTVSSPDLAAVSAQLDALRRQLAHMQTDEGVRQRLDRLETVVARLQTHAHSAKSPRTGKR